MKPKGIDLQRASKIFDKLLAKVTKKDFEEWLKMDEERSKKNNNDRSK